MIFMRRIDFIQRNRSIFFNSIQAWLCVAFLAFKITVKNASVVFFCTMSLRLNFLLPCESRVFYWTDVVKRAKSICRYPGCGVLLDLPGYCVKHAKHVEQQRGSSTERGYNHRWRKARETYLRSNPLCVICDADGVLTPATVVDHITPHRGDQKLFWSRGNWQALCKRHHDRKTAKEDGGFGRPPSKV